MPFRARAFNYDLKVHITTHRRRDICICFGGYLMDGSWVKNNTIKN